MSNKPQPWPYTAADIRDRAAEETVSAIRLLEPLTNLETDIERLRKLSQALSALYRTTRLLESAGANTRP